MGSTCLVGNRGGCLCWRASVRWYRLSWRLQHSLRCNWNLLTQAQPQQDLSYLTNRRVTHYISYSTFIFFWRHFLMRLCFHLPVCTGLSGIFQSIFVFIRNLISIRGGAEAGMCGCLHNKRAVENDRDESAMVNQQGRRNKKRLFSLLWPNVYVSVNFWINSV